MLFFVALSACVTEPKPAPAVVYALPYVVLKSTWKYCYDLCGKKDLLAAVSSKGCICTNGGTIPFHNDLPEEQKPIENVEEKKQITDTVIDYLKGNK